MSLDNSNNVEPKKHNLGKIFGILSIVFSPIGIVGLVLSIVGLKKSLDKNSKILNIIGLVFSVLLTALELGYLCYIFIDFLIKLFEGITTGVVENIVS